MNELSYLCGLKNHAMNSEKFAEITAQCQPHEVFSNDWTTFYPDDFADTLLPDAGIIKGKSLRFYDGAGIVPTTGSFPQHYMKLSTNDQIVSLIFFSYPKGVPAGEKIEGVRPGHDELCAFFEIEKNDNIHVRLKAGGDFKKILHSIAADDHSKDISKSIDTLEFETSLSKFQAFFKPEISHYAMLSFVGFITGADLVKKHNKTVPGIKPHKLEAYTSEPADNKKRRVKEEQRLQLKIGFTVTNTAIHHCVLTVTHKGKVIHCSTYLSAVTCAGQMASETPITALQNELQALESSELPPKDEILPPDDYYLYWDCTDFIHQQTEIGELLITMKVVTAEGNSKIINYPKANVKELFQNAKENNYIIVLNNNDEEVQVFGASIIDRQTRFIKRIAEIYDTLSDEHKLILHLPEIMVKVGWLHGALCQIHWLEGSGATLKFPYEFFMSEERVKDIDKIKLEEYFKEISFLSKNDVNSEELIEDGYNRFLYNTSLEYVKNALDEFKKDINTRGAYGPVGDFLIFADEEDTHQKEDTINETFFQSFAIGGSADLDDIGAALGHYSLKCYYQGFLYKDHISNQWFLDIENVNCRFTDPFNFKDAKNDSYSQPLGLWPNNNDINNYRTFLIKELFVRILSYRNSIRQATTAIIEELLYEILKDDVQTKQLSRGTASRLAKKWDMIYLDNATFNELRTTIQQIVKISCNDFNISSNLRSHNDEFLKKSIRIS